MKAKFIVLYGINNLGKSTQAKKLVERLVAEGHEAEYLKYPRYDIEPSGRLINEAFREGNPHNFSKREIQLLNVWNRDQFEPTLRAKLDAGITIVGEDYTGSGLAWGIGTNVDEAFMKSANAHLLKEDLAFVFDGNRFTEATEATHIFETKPDLQEKVRIVYKRLGEEFCWVPIDANRTIEEIHETIWQHVSKILS